MSRNDFDELLLNKLRNEDFEYNPASWQKLSDMLPPEQKEKPHTLPLAGSAVPSFWQKWKTASAAAAVLLTTGTLSWLMLNHNPEKTTETITAGNTTVKKEIASNKNQGETQLLTNSISLSNTTKPSNSGTAIVPKKNNKGLQTKAIVSLAASKQQLPLQNEPVIIQLPTTEIEQPQQLKAPNNSKLTTVNEHIALERNVQKEYLSPAQYLNEQLTTTQQNTGARTSVAVSGGMNYGNTNTGYSAGLSLKQKIAGNLFVDGAVAMVYNNNAANMAINNGKPLEMVMADMGKNTNASKSSNSVPTPSLQPIERLYYVQVNPSVGYQIQKNVSLSVGGDFQRVLNIENETLQISKYQDNKILPRMDVGLTTKSEITVTPNLQAGILYREGMNNLLKQGNVEYVNRRYFQVQFKYNLPIR